MCDPSDVVASFFNAWACYSYKVKCSGAPSCTQCEKKGIVCQFHFSTVNNDESSQPHIAAGSVDGMGEQATGNDGLDAESIEDSLYPSPSATDPKAPGSTSDPKELDTIVINNPQVSGTSSGLAIGVMLSLFLTTFYRHLWTGVFVSLHQARAEGT